MREPFVAEGELHIFWRNCCFEHTIMLDKRYLDDLAIESIGPAEEKIEIYETGKHHIISYHFGRVRITVDPLSAGNPWVITNKLEAPYCSCCDRHLYIDFLKKELAELIISEFGLEKDRYIFDGGRVRIAIEKVVDPSSALREYRGYLESVESKAGSLLEEEYLGLLNEAKVFDLLITRDELEEADLSAEAELELRWLDDTLLRHSRLVTHNIPPYPEKPRAYWWWHLHERMEPDEAADAARARRRSWVTNKIWDIIRKVEYLPRQIESWNDKDDGWKGWERHCWTETMADLDDLDRRCHGQEMYPSQEARYQELKIKLKESLPLLDCLGFEKPRVDLQEHY